MSELFFTLGSAAIGTIQPHATQQDRLEEFTQRIASGEFHKEVSGNSIPARCVDGRSLAAGAHSLAPNGAGGSQSLFVGDDLTTKTFAALDDTVLSAYKNTLDAITHQGHEIGGHTGTHTNGEKSGCGANDRLSEIYRYIATSADVLRDMAVTLGVVIPDAIHELIVRNASTRTNFSKGAELFEHLQGVANPEYVDILDGAHNEVAVVVNTRSGTTLDRTALGSEFGDSYQAFNVDVWSFTEAAAIGSQSSDETAQRFIAMVYYNLATAMVLAGPQLRVIVLA